MKGIYFRKYTNYFFILSIIALTGFDYFFRANNLIYLLFILSTFVFLNRRLRVDFKAILLIIIITIVTIFQSIKFSFTPFYIITTLIRFFTYFFIAKITIKDFDRLFVKIVTGIAIISLPLYLLINISDVYYQYLITLGEYFEPLGFTDYTDITWTNPSKSIIIFTIPLSEDIRLRNCGPFWEPGMFAVFINIAIALNVIRKEKLFSKSTIVLIITSITTLSATSWIATFLIVAFFYMFIKRNFYSFIMIVLLGIAAIPIYNSDVISSKFVSNYESIDQSYSRFGAIFLHWEMIKESPFIGYGMNAGDEQSLIFGEFQVSPNGLTNIIRYYGIPLSLLLYILLYKSTKNMIEPTKRKYAILIYLTLLIVAFSQDVTTRHFYYVLYFFFAINCDIKKNILCHEN